MYNEQKANGTLTREKSKCHNWNTRKCKISPNLPLGSLEIFICGELSPKFQMHNKQKGNSTLIREKSKCHNWSTRKCGNSTQVWNFDS